MRWMVRVRRVMGPVITRENTSAAAMAATATAAKAVNIRACTPSRLVISSCTEEMNSTAPRMFP